jgi:hypothetical protein
MFGLAARPTARHAYFLELLLPHLHLALGPQEELVRASHAQAGLDGAQQVFLLLAAEDDDGVHGQATKR